MKDVDPARVREELDRLLSSTGLTRNARMSQFLRYLIERRLEGKEEELKESVIGVEVFGRRTDYDPKLDSIVRTEAARLRARLAEYYAGEGASNPVVIQVPKGGYVPVFAPREDSRSGAIARHRRWPAVAVLTAAAVVLASFGFWSTVRRHDPVRIAVLPFVNLSAHPSSEYFVDGLTDELIRNLSVIEGLIVRSRTSSFVWKDRPPDVREAGRELGVDFVLEGSVLREGDELRVNAQVIRVRDDAPIWSGRYRRKATDVFAIQDEISLGIVNNLRVHLGRGRRRYETSVEAYDHYLHANALASPSVLFSEREPVPASSPEERFLHSIRAYQSAIAKDPHFAPAYAGLAIGLAIHSVQFPAVHPPDELENMRTAQVRALELDPLLPEAHHAAAMASARDGQWQEAERRFRRAIELDPNQSAIRSNYAYWLLAALGRHADALEQLKAAQKADPLSADVRRTTALVLIAAGRYDEAAVHCAELPANDQCMARVRAGQGRFDDVIQLLEHHPDVRRSPQAKGFLAYAYARSGRRLEAETSVSASRFPNEQALTYAGLADHDRAIEALERMAVLGPQQIGLYLDYPELALVRGDVRVKALRHQVGLPDAP